MGRNLGVNLPDIRALNWITVRTPLSVAALPLVRDLGPNENQVLALALEFSNPVVVLDDNLARQMARSLVRFRFMDVGERTILR
jgi:predicted nucleic acid-binding protein